MSFLTEVKFLAHPTGHTFLKLLLQKQSNARV